MDRLPLALDHLYVFVAPGFPEADHFCAPGLNLWPGRKSHTGIGTSSAAAPFENAYLELLYQDDAVSAAELSATEAETLRLRADWKQSGACPFGVAFRADFALPDRLPIPTRKSSKSWMPEKSAILEFGAEPNPFAPEFFIVPPSIALPIPLRQQLLGFGRQDLAAALDHKLPAGHLTSIRLVLADPRAWTPETRWFQSTGFVRLEEGPAPLLELTFDHGRRGLRHSFQPELPLVFLL